MFKKFAAALVALFLAATAFAAVDANKATQAELESVKGIGPAISTLIINERKKGDFKDWNDMVVRVKGVGEKNAAKMSDSGLTVNGATFTGAPAPATTAKTTKTAEKAPMAERAASGTKAVASKAASAVKTGAEKAASATKGAAKVVKDDAKEQKDAVKENVQDAKAKRAEKKAEKAAAASAAK